MPPDPDGPASSREVIELVGVWVGVAVPLLAVVLAVVERKDLDFGNAELLGAMITTAGVGGGLIWWAVRPAPRRVHWRAERALWPVYAQLVYGCLAVLATVALAVAMLVVATRPATGHPPAPRPSAGPSR